MGAAQCRAGREWRLCSAPAVIAMTRGSEKRFPFSRKLMAKATSAPGSIAPFACPNKPLTPHPSHIARAGSRTNHINFFFGSFIGSPVGSLRVFAETRRQAWGPRRVSVTYRQPEGCSCLEDEVPLQEDISRAVVLATADVKLSKLRTGS